MRVARKPMIGLGAALVASLALAQSPPPLVPAAGRYRAGAQAYVDKCSGCHGTDLAGGRGPSLFDPALLGRRDDAQIAQIVLNGIPGAEMPAFRGVLTEEQAYAIAAWLRVHAAEAKGRPAFVPDPADRIIRSEKQAFRIEVVAKGLDTPWGLAFLPDGRLLVTERAGRLRIIDRQGRLLPDAVKGLPTPWVRQDGGYFDIALHPDYRRNRWIYLSYSEVLPGHVVTEGELHPPAGTRNSPPSMTVLIRGRIDARGQWIDNQLLWRAPPQYYAKSDTHYGSRFLFDGKGHLFFSIGEGGDMTNAQKLDVPLGKIHRINDDGSVPADNPFVHTPGAVPTIWSYGHRNPEGLAWNPSNGDLWESEHGPSGGDEINVIDKGHDYGWGVVTNGIQPASPSAARRGWTRRSSITRRRSRRAGSISTPAIAIRAGRMICSSPLWPASNCAG